MKNVKLLLLSLLVGFSFYACKDDDIEDMVPPGVDFNFTPSSPVEGIQVLFYSDPTEGSSEISEWHWQFGDANNSTSNKRNPYFTYTTAGTYTVKLTVKNRAGGTFDVSKTIEVAEPPKELITNIVWEFNNNTTVSKLNEGSSAPVIGNDGTIYYVEGNAAKNSKVVAVTDNGTTAALKWATTTADYISNAPSIGPDGHIYVNTWATNNMVYKLNGTTGEVMWTKGGRGASNTTPAVDAQGNIYHGSRVQSSDGGLYSWSPTGEKRWQIINQGAFYSSPVLSKDETTVYALNTNEGKIWAVNTADGTMKWSESVGMGSGTHGTSISMGADGTIYYTTNAHIVAITDNGATGTVKWSADVTGAAQSGVVIGPAGDLYTGAGAGLVSLNPTTGAINWTYPMSTTESVPAVDVEGRVYIGSTNGRLVVVTKDGILMKEIELGDGAVNSPTIANDGTVFVEALSGSNIKLFKISVAESGPAKSFWPMKGRNVKNTSQSK